MSIWHRFLHRSLMMGASYFYNILFQGQNIFSYHFCLEPGQLGTYCRSTHQLTDTWCSQYKLLLAFRYRQITISLEFDAEGRLCNLHSYLHQMAEESNSHPCIWERCKFLSPRNPKEVLMDQQFYRCRMFRINNHLLTDRWCRYCNLQVTFQLSLSDLSLPHHHVLRLGQV